MPEQITHVQQSEYANSLLARLRGSDEDPEAGRVSRGLLIGLGAAVGGLAVAGLALKGIAEKYPDEVPKWVGSALGAEQDDLKAIDIQCVTAGVWDMKDAAASLTLKVGDREYDRFGNGLRVQQGKVVKVGCVEGGGITFDKKTIDGQEKIVGTVDRTAIVWDARLSQDTLIVEAPPSGRQALDGILDTGTGIGRSLCEGFNTIFGRDNEGCDDLANRIANAKNVNKAEFQTTFRRDLIQFVQTNCAQSAWPAEEAAVIDSLKKQLERQGADPDKLVYQLVDENGKPTKELPDPTGQALKELNDSGAINGDPKVGLTLKYENQKCDAMTVGEYEKSRGSNRPEFDPRQ